MNVCIYVVEMDPLHLLSEKVAGGVFASVDSTRILLPVGLCYNVRKNVDCTDSNWGGYYPICVCVGIEYYLHILN